MSVLFLLRVSTDSLESFILSRIPVVVALGPILVPQALTLSTVV